MKFSEIPSNLRGLITKGIRDAYKRSDSYKRHLKRTRVEVVKYNKDGSISKKPSIFQRCDCCNKLFKQKEIQVDHIVPVIPVKSKLADMTLNEYALRVFNNPCQVLSKTCHKSKTKLENKSRKKPR